MLAVVQRVLSMGAKVVPADGYTDLFGKASAFGMRLAYLCAFLFELLQQGEMHV
ncbi:hypothetical protein D3C72_106640 [compost metagenome]